MDMFSMLGTMAKSFGLDPEILKKQINDCYDMVKSIDDALKNIAANQQIILEKLNARESKENIFPQIESANIPTNTDVIGRATSGNAFVNDENGNA